MGKQLKKMIALNRSDLILCTALPAGIFLLLQIVIGVVMAVAKPEDGVRVSGLILVFSNVILMLVLTLGVLLVNYPQAVQFGCTRRRALLLTAGLLGAEYAAATAVAAAATLIEMHLCTPFWTLLTGRSVQLDFFLESIQLPWWGIPVIPLIGVAAGLLISAVLHRFGRAGGWTLWGIWMFAALGQSFLPWESHWWSFPWLAPAAGAVALAGTVWSVWSLLHLSIKT